MRKGAFAEAAVTHSDVWGLREAKYTYLLSHSLGSTPASAVHPSAGLFLFVPQNEDAKADFSQFVAVSEVFESGSNGIQTSRDHVVYDFTEKECRQVIEEFRSPERAIQTPRLRQKYWPRKKVATYEPGDTRGWRVPEAREELRSDKAWESRFVRSLYRPLDFRMLFFADYMIDWPRMEVMSQMLRPNLSLCVGRAGSAASNQEWNIVFVADTLVDMNLFYRGGNVNFPLRVSRSAQSLGLNEWESKPNFQADFIKAISDALGLTCHRSGELPEALTAEDILYYAYAVFNSPSYRARYADLLKFDFPRLPLISNPELFQALARIGGELVAVHLMEREEPGCRVATYSGPVNPEVGRVGWSNDTVWLDAAATKRGQPAKAGTIGFQNVPEAVWHFRIGGYQVCEKWLKDRKRRRLSKDEVTHYQRLVAALAETIRLMEEVDEVIEQHGGWPSAFQTDKTQDLSFTPFDSHQGD